MDIVISYLVLVTGILIIGTLWGIIGESGDRKSVIRLTGIFVAWGLFAYTFQLVTGISV